MREHAPTQAAAAILRLGVFIQCVGLYWIAIGKGSALNGLFFLSLDWSEPTAQLIDRGGAMLVTAAAAAALWWPRAWGLYALIAAWMTFVAAASWHQGGAPFSDWSMLAWAIRIAAPAIAALWGRGLELSLRAQWIARAAIAATFALHGVEALSMHPGFVDLVIGAGQRFFHVWWEQHAVQRLLGVIGVVDLVVAALLLCGKRWRWLVMYMALWGFVTALSRVVESGSIGFGETMLRCCHGALPLALWWLWRPQSSPQEQRDTIPHEAPSPT